MSTDVREVVKEKYGQAALRVKTGEGNACCGAGAAFNGSCDPITSNLYGEGEQGVVPEEALKASLGCGKGQSPHRLEASQAWSENLRGDSPGERPPPL